MGNKLLMPTDFAQKIDELIDDIPLNFREQAFEHLLSTIQERAGFEIMTPDQACTIKDKLNAISDEMYEILNDPKYADSTTEIIEEFTAQLNKLDNTVNDIPS